MPINSKFSSSFSGDCTIECQSCGQRQKRLINIIIGNKQWHVCDTDKCIRDVLKKAIIEVV
jgi:hypothetical protein